MVHVHEIRNMVESGAHEAAHEALDLLLSLGPGNIEALKLKCFLYAAEGRFREEARVWAKVLDQDYEDADALSFFQRRQIEEKEGFYFTDPLPSGGRRFLAHPRALINASLLGLLGCTVFLLVSSYAQKYHALSSGWVAFGSFSLCVLVPWLMIVLAWSRSLRSIVLTQQGVEFNTRFSRRTLAWKEIRSVFLAYERVAGEQKLSVIFMPLDPAQKGYEVELSREHSVIRARSLLIEDISFLFRKPQPVRRQTLELQSVRLLSF